MKTLRAVIFPREVVPLAVRPDAGSGLESAATNFDLWHESDVYMHTAGFTLPMASSSKWQRHKRVGKAAAEAEAEEGAYDG